MSVVPMKLLTVAGPLARFDDVMASCVIDQEFHPENALQLMKKVSGLRPLSFTNPYTPLLRRAEEVMTSLGLEPAYASVGEDLNPDALPAYFDSLEQQRRALEEEQARQEQFLDEDESLSQELDNLKGPLWMSCGG